MKLKTPNRMIKRITELTKARYIVAIIILPLLCFSMVFTGIAGLGGIVSDAANSDEVMINVVGMEADGDCIIITYKNIEILIDTASSKGYDSFKRIVRPKVEEAMSTDAEHVWEYVIFTHPDEDHIGNADAFFNLFEEHDTENWVIGTIIDYDSSEIQTSEYGSLTSKAYRTIRDDYCKEYGTDYFAVGELKRSEKEQVYPIDRDLQLHILYNYYDDPSNKSEFEDKKIDPNLMSVCCLLEYKGQKMLFTGDLEAKAEEKLIEEHADLLQNVTFYKAAHHGSDSSNSVRFVDTIRPEYVAITKNKNANLPDESINNFLKYTDRIYLTYVKESDSDSFVELYGDLKFYLDGYRVRVESENNQKADNIRDAKIEGINWFNSVLNDDSRKLEDRIYVYTITEEEAAYNNCTLIKYGHYDIIIDCGSDKSGSTKLIEKLKKYVVDKEIECLIVSHYHYENISQIVGASFTNQTGNECIFNAFTIDCIVDGTRTNLESTYDDSFYKRYKKLASQNVNRNSIDPTGSAHFDYTANLSLDVMGSGNGASNDENEYSLISLIQYRNEKYLFAGDQIKYDYINSHYKNVIKNVDFMRLSNSLVPIKESAAKSYRDFLRTADPKYSVIGTTVGYSYNGRTVFGDDYRYTLKRNITNSNNICYCDYVYNKRYECYNGDIVYVSGYPDRGSFYRPMMKTDGTMVMGSIEQLD